MDRRGRLAKLLILQRKVKELHEARRASYLKEAAAAEAEANALMERLEASDSLADLFPGLYEERIRRAFDRRDGNLATAAREAKEIATANARANVVERIHREIERRHERSAEEKAILELIEQKLKPG